METIDFLLIDDEQEQEEQLKSIIDTMNTDREVKLTYKAVKTCDEAVVALYQNNFHAIIVDLNLENSDNSQEENENISGNILLNQIINKEIVPIVVRTGLPEKISDEINKDIIKVYSKDEPFVQIINELIESYSDSVFKIFGSKGQIAQKIKQLFWEVIPECYSNKSEISSLLPEQKEHVIIRYISSWFFNQYIFDEEYHSVDPIEMYMFPNPIKQVCTCDIFAKQIEDGVVRHYLVVTPACDLANKKVNRVLMCEIKKYIEVQKFIETLDRYRNNQNNSHKNSLTKWFRNASSDSAKYHFLPKVSMFNGGFIDFCSLQSVEYNQETGELADSSYYKVGVITEHFKKDIIARFSAYYHRQGQPEFNTDSILEKLTSDFS